MVGIFRQRIDQGTEMIKQVFGILLFIFAQAVVSADKSDNHPEFIIGLNQNIIPDLTPTESNLALKLIDKDFGEFSKLRVSHINYANLAAMQRDFEKGVINFIILPSIEVVKNFSKDKLGGGLTIGSRGQLLDTLLLVVRKNEAIEGFPDLNGQKLSMLEKDELTNIYLKTLIYRSEIDNKKCFLSKINTLPTSNRLILQLFFKQTDAVIVFQSQLQLALEMNPVIDKHLKIIDQYENISGAVGFFSNIVNTELQEYIISSLIKFQHTVRGKQLLLLFKTDEYRRINWQQMEPLIKLYDEYLLLKKRSKNNNGCQDKF